MKHDTIFKKNDKVTGLNFLVYGEIAVMKDDGVVQQVYSPGDILAVEEFVHDRELRGFTAEVISDKAQVFFMTNSHMKERVLPSNPDIRSKLHNVR